MFPYKILIPEDDAFLILNISRLLMNKAKTLYSSRKNKGNMEAIGDEKEEGQDYLDDGDYDDEDDGSGILNKVMDSAEFGETSIES